MILGVYYTYNNPYNYNTYYKTLASDREFLSQVQQLKKSTRVNTAAKSKHTAVGVTRATRDGLERVRANEGLRSMNDACIHLLKMYSELEKQQQEGGE